MKYGTKVFLAVGVPSVLLLATGLFTVTFLFESLYRREAQGDLERAREAFVEVERILEKRVEVIRVALDSPRVLAAMSGAVEDPEFRRGDLPEILRQVIHVALGVPEMAVERPFFYSILGDDGEVILREPAAAGPAAERTLVGADPARTHHFQDDRRVYMARVTRISGYRLRLTLIVGESVGESIQHVCRTSGTQVLYGAGSQGIVAEPPDLLPLAGELSGGGPKEAAGRIFFPEKLGGDLWRAVAVDVSPHRRFVQRLRWTGVGLCAAGLVIALAVGLSFSRAMSGPVTRLVEAARRIGSGDFETRVSVSSRDELGTLARAFNEMSVGLAERERRRAVMDKVLSRDVSEALMESDLKLGGTVQEITAYFLDVRGYTKLSEGMDPHEVLRLLNDYLRPAIRCVEANHGVINKFLGDGFLAIFGAPRPLADHATWAVRCGVETVRALRALGSDLSAGIGIHTGPALAGRMGSEERMEYTVIGESVNLSSRLCARAAPNQILVSRETRRAVGDQAAVRELSPMTLKGFSVPIEVFEVTVP